MEGVRAYGSEEAKAILDGAGDGGRSLSKSASEESSGASGNDVPGVISSDGSEA